MCGLWFIPLASTVANSLDLLSFPSRVLVEEMHPLGTLLWKPTGIDYKKIAHANTTPVIDVPTCDSI